MPAVVRAMTRMRKPVELMRIMRVCVECWRGVRTHPLTVWCERKAPFTIAKSASDYSTQIVTSGSGIVPIPYNEGLFIDYRHFDQFRACVRATAD